MIFFFFFCNRCVITSLWKKDARVLVWAEINVCIHMRNINLRPVTSSHMVKAFSSNAIIIALCFCFPLEMKIFFKKSTSKINKWKGFDNLFEISWGKKNNNVALLLGHSILHSHRDASNSFSSVPSAVTGKTKRPAVHPRASISEENLKFLKNKAVALSVSLHLHTRTGHAGKSFQFRRQTRPSIFRRRRRPSANSWIRSRVRPRETVGTVEWHSKSVMLKLRALATVAHERAS